MMVLEDIRRVGDTVIGVIAEVAVNGVTAGEGLVISGRKLPKYVLVKRGGDCQVLGIDGEEVPSTEFTSEVTKLIDDFASPSK